MKAIFLCQQKGTCKGVYDENTLAKLNLISDLDYEIYTKEDIIASPYNFSDTQVIFSTWGMQSFTEDEIRTYLPSLECIFYAAGSVQGFARSFLNCGVKVFSAWGANGVPVAEMTVAQIILSNKGYFLTNRLYHSSGNNVAKGVIGDLRGNFDETVGIIGAGMIGTLVIQMLKQYRLNVIVFDPFLSDERAQDLGVEKCSLDDVFSRAFVVSNHLANNVQTQGMINYDLFRLMRKNAVFINTGRGAQVVEDDLIRILQERPDLTALLDVTEPEPPVLGHPFYTLPNCMLTPHIAGSLGYEIRRMGEYMLDEYTSYINGAECKYEVTLKMLETMA